MALGRTWGLRLEADGRAITLYTPPVLGGYRTALPDRYGLAVAVGALLVALLPTLARRLRWSAPMATAVVATGAWWAALAQLDGAGGFTRGLEWDTDWGPRLAVSAGPAELLRTYVDQLPSSSIQVRGHPPGFLLFTLALRSFGMARPAVVATILFLAGLSAVVAVLLSVRLLIDETAARRLVPYLVLAPAALWLVMAPDTLYVAVTAWLVYLLLVALHTPGGGPTSWPSPPAWLAAAALLSYGLVLMAFVPLLAAVHRRRWRPLVVAAGTAVALVVALVPFGFWWFAGSRHPPRLRLARRSTGRTLLLRRTTWPPGPGHRARDRRRPGPVARPAALGARRRRARCGRRGRQPLRALRRRGRAHLAAVHRLGSSSPPPPLGTAALVERGLGSPCRCAAALVLIALVATYW